MNLGTITPPPTYPPTAARSGTPVVRPQPALTPYRWTIAAYRKLAVTGLFNDMKTMLLHGELYTMAMPDPPHNLSLGLVADWLASAFGAGYHVRNQMAFDIGTHNDPGPDLAVVVGSRRDYANRQATEAVLIVEVADSSLFIDTTTKAELYATAGVADYWVLDLEQRQLVVFHDPQPLPKGLGATAYRTRLTLASTERVSPLAAPQASILVSELLS